MTTLTEILQDLCDKLVEEGFSPPRELVLEDDDFLRLQRELGSPKSASRLKLSLGLSVTRECLR